MKKVRSPAEELALRRSQLARRQRRVATKSGDASVDGSFSSTASAPTKERNGGDFDSTSASASVVPSVQAAKERAARMAQAELEMEKKARAEAEHRAACVVD